jgi:hypothetical protein
MTKRIGLAVMVIGLTAGAGADAQAAVVSWLGPTNISGDADVSTNGSLVAAFNVGGPGVADTTVNGVTFTGLAVSGPSVTSGNFTLAIASGEFASNNDVGSPSPPFSSLSAGYQSMLSTAAGDFTTPITLTMGGLAVGQQYEFQWWSNLSNSLRTTTTATAGNSVSLTTNTTALEGGLGQFAVGTFTADASSQVITFSSGNQDVLNGFQLRTGTAAIPEPSTFAMAGLMTLVGLGYAWRRRRAA